MTELEKAQKTIEELMEINEELAGLNDSQERTRERIRTLETRLHERDEKIYKYQRKLNNRKEVIKAAIKELLVEYLETLQEED